MVGMPGTPGPTPDPHPLSYSSVNVCVCVFTILVQSRAVGRGGGLDSAVQTLSPGDKDPPVLVCFMRSLISHAGSSVLTLSQPAITCSPRTCPHQDISPQFPPSTASSHLANATSPLQAWTPSPSCRSQLEIPQHNRFWALPPSPQR